MLGWVHEYRPRADRRACKREGNKSLRRRIHSWKQWYVLNRLSAYPSGLIYASASIIYLRCRSFVETWIRLACAVDLVLCPLSSIFKTAMFFVIRSDSRSVHQRLGERRLLSRFCTGRVWIHRCPSVPPRRKLCRMISGVSAAQTRCALAIFSNVILIHTHGPGSSEPRMFGTRDVVIGAVLLLFPKSSNLIFWYMSADLISSSNHAPRIGESDPLVRTTSVLTSRVPSGTNVLPC